MISEWNFTCCFERRFLPSVIYGLLLLLYMSLTHFFSKNPLRSYYFHTAFLAMNHLPILHSQDHNAYMHPDIKEESTDVLRYDSFFVYVKSILWYAQWLLSVSVSSKTFIKNFMAVSYLLLPHLQPCVKQRESRIIPACLCLPHILYPWKPSDRTLKKPVGYTRVAPDDYALQIVSCA